MVRGLFLTISMIAVFVAPAAAAEPKKVALLVGVEGYRHNDLTKLNYCCDDVRTLAGILKAQGFECRLLVDEGFGEKAAGKPGDVKPVALPTRAKIAAELKGLLKGLTRDDLALVVLSGHGLQPSGATQPYFCPLDANPTTKIVYVEKDNVSRPTQQLVEPDTLVGLGDLLADLKSSGVGRKLVLVDACRDAPTTKGSKSTGVTTVSLDLLPSSCSLLMSCTDGEQSFESDKLGTGGRGVFLNAVIEGFEGKAADENGDISWGMLALHVTKSVPRSMQSLYGGKREQTPHEVKNLPGDVLLARRVTEPPLPLSPPERASPLQWPFSESEAKAGQTAWAKSLGQPVVEKNSAGHDMVLLPPGTYTMGSPAGEDGHQDDETQVSVTLTRAYRMSRTEVTVGQFRKFVTARSYKTEAESDSKGGYGFDESTGKFEQKPEYTWKNPGFPQTDSHPVVNVSWNDAVAYCEWLSVAEGKTYRLPTEAEWEWACRAGTRTAWSSGSDPEGLATTGNVADGTAKAKFSGWMTISGKDGFVFTAPVGQFRANAFGLSDMHGNVMEWCGDWYDDKLAGGRDPAGASSGSIRVYRGGSWYSTPALCRSAFRYGDVPSSRNDSLGFRLVLSPSVK